MKNKNILLAVLVVALVVVAYLLGGSSPVQAPVFALTSSAFANGASIPSQYTCDGTNISPPLAWSHAPAGTKSFALVMYDPDVPTAVLPTGFFDHWEVFNIPADATGLTASSTVGTQGNNGAKALGYTGPCPPTQYAPKEHRYIFTLYALDDQLSLQAGADRNHVEGALAGHILGTAQLIGRYQKIGK